jgi:hypothetical protein
MACCGPPRNRAHTGRAIMSAISRGNSVQSTQAVFARAAVAAPPALCRPQRRPERPGCCMYLGKNDPVQYPDPGLYSQAEQIALGNVPDWDNPDITTNEWAPFRLLPESQITIHNYSSTVSAVNTLVNFSIAPFGIGMPRTLIASKQLSIAPASEVDLLFPLPQAVLEGDQRIGVYIQVDHPTDSNYHNNDGAQVHDGSYTTESGRSFTLPIPVYNDSNFTRQIQLSVMPTDVIASVTPASHLFAPHEQIIATLAVDVPGFLVGSTTNVIARAVTVVGRAATGELVGGATKLLRINS